MLVDTVVVLSNTEHVDKETGNPSIIRKTTNPVDMYLLSLTIEAPEQGMKYVQS